MGIFGLGSAAGAGGLLGALSAFNPAALFTSLAATVATSAIQQGAGELAGKTGGGFFGNLLGSLVEPFSNGLTGFVQNWLGGANTKNS